jgi:hypothetical protein
MSSAPPANDLRPLLQSLDERGPDKVMADLDANRLDPWWYDHKTGKWHHISLHPIRACFFDAEEVAAAACFGWPVQRGWAEWDRCEVFAAPAAKHPGGPKPKYNRQGVTAYLEKHIREMGKLPTHTKLREMAEGWFLDRYPKRKPPEDTWLKDLATEIRKKFSHEGH